MCNELSNLFDEGIEFVTTLLINKHKQQIKTNKRIISNDYLEWLQRTGKEVEKNFPNYSETELLLSIVSKIDSGDVNALTDHQMILKLISQLMKDCYKMN